MTMSFGVFVMALRIATESGIALNKRKQMEITGNRSCRDLRRIISIASTGWVKVTAFWAEGL